MTSISRTLATTVLAGLVLTAAAVGGETTPDKRQYTLFNPTPIDQMRPLSADRPDGTESPYTVDAGHFQLEVSLFDFAHDNDRGERTDAYTILDTNFKVGLNQSNRFATDHASGRA